MVRMNHGGLPMAALHGRSPPPYTFVTGDLNFPSKIWSKSVVHSPDPSEATLKRRITTALPSITTTHHDGGLPSQLSYTLANDDPPPPSIPTQRSRQNLRDRRLFRNNGWTKWEAVQLADELEAKRAMVKADWECWKETDKQQEALDLQVNGPFLFEWDDLSEEALRDADKRLRQRWNAYKQMETEMAISSHFVKSNKERTTNPSPHYHQIGSQHEKESDKRKQRRTRRKKAGTTTDVGSSDDCTISKDEGSTEGEEDNKESSEAKVKIADCVITGSSDFVVSSPDDDHKGGIESVIGGGDAQCEACIGSDGLLSLIPHNCFVYSPRECRDTKLVLQLNSVVSSWEREEDNWILKIFVKIQGADLWRFDKHKKRATLGTGEYPPVMNCTLFAVHKALKYGWVIIPYHLMLYTKGVAE